MNVVADSGRTTCKRVLEKCARSRSLVAYNARSRTLTNMVCALARSHLHLRDVRAHACQPLGTLPWCTEQTHGKRPSLQVISEPSAEGSARTCRHEHAFQAACGATAALHLQSRRRGHPRTRQPVTRHTRTHVIVRKPPIASCQTTCAACALSAARCAFSAAAAALALPLPPTAAALLCSDR